MKMEKKITLKRSITLFVVTFIVLFTNIYLFSDHSGPLGAIIQTLAVQSLVFIPLFILMLLQKMKTKH